LSETKEGRFPMKQPRFEMMGQIVITLALCLIAAPALAGIADSPLPVLVAGKKTFHVYSVSGVGHWGGYYGAYFSCTSTATVPMQVGVEVFDDAGGGPANDAVTTSLSVDPGATARFGTASAVGIAIYSDLGVGIVAGGSARILATSKKLVCTAFLAERFNAPPTSMVYLTIVKKLTQKGE
jgi:hypothetical protein